MRILTSISSVLIMSFLPGCLAAPPVSPVFSRENAAQSGDQGASEPEFETPVNDDRQDPELIDPEEDATPVVEIPPMPEPDPVDEPIPEPTPVPTFAPKLAEMSVSATDGTALVKGKGARVIFKWTNEGTLPGKVSVAPFLSATRFGPSFQNIPLPTMVIDLAASQSLVRDFAIPMFFQDATAKKHFALTSGSYTLSFKISKEGGPEETLNGVPGSDFNVEKSNAVFASTLWSRQYFLNQSYSGTIDQYMRESFTRKSEIFDSSFRTFNGGFEEMMNVKMHFKTFDNSELDTNSGDGVEILNSAARIAQGKMGLNQPFALSAQTHADNQGFDVLIMLSGKHTFGGFGYIGGNISANTVFESDRSKGRSQMIVVHEMGHNFGANHCDPLQGYLMCSGEKHSRYTNGGSFVWHKDSTDAMNKLDFNINSSLAKTQQATQESFKLHDCHGSH